MKKSCFPARGGFVLCLAVLCLAAGLSACLGSLLDDPLKTPGNFRIEAYPYMVHLSWDPVPGVSGYRIRLNGEVEADLSDPSASSWDHVTPVVLGGRYTLSAVYSNGGESLPAGPLKAGKFMPPYTLTPPDPDSSPRSIISAPGAAQPTRWADAAFLPGQTAHYYIIPIDDNYTTYRIWWNDSLDGDSTKNLNISVEVWWYGSNSLITPFPVDSGYTAAGITINTTSPPNTGYAVLKVEPYFSEKTGTYGIAYTYN